jgi:Asp-tRNA(Asn)/Glu-tRNA(Gln) amidotransferase A subunit family amidase
MEVSAMSELYWKPAHELAAMIRKRELKPSELMDVTIRRIEQTNPKLNAFVALRADAAMAEARALDEKIARGEKIGTLAGLPLGVKDLEDTVGLVTSHGSKPFKDNVASKDSIQVARLKLAGAIVIGKTNAPEFGYTAFTKNLLFGPTRNPWNLERTPGGSSGGTSAAIAGGVVPISTGSDGGGSVRIPACYTGCYGLKPTYGRIPNDPTLGMQQWNDTSVHGPIVRTVRDAALFMDAVVGYHAADPDSLPHPGISYAAILEGLPKKLRIAFHPDFGQLVQTEFNDWCQRVFERFDLLLCPVLPTEAFPARGPMPAEINGQPLKHPLDAVVFTYPFNMSGHPGASVRAGLTDSGLPCGLQIVAERHREDLVLQASYAYEQARPWNNKWPEI